MSYFLPVSGNTTFLGKDMWRGRGPGVRYTMDISQEMLDRKTKGSKMRVTFTMEIKAEIESFDIKKREVFVKLMSEAARGLHAKAVMLSDRVSPNMKVTVADNSGETQVKLFAGEKE